MKYIGIYACYKNGDKQLVGFYLIIKYYSLKKGVVKCFERPNI